MIYQWFHVYEFDIKKVQFKHSETMELYLDKDVLGAGHFHEVKKCHQYWRYDRSDDPESPIKETRIEPGPKNYVIKKSKKFEEICEVPLDILK